MRYIIIINQLNFQKSKVLKLPTYLTLYVAFYDFHENIIGMWKHSENNS